MNKIKTSLYAASLFVACFLFASCSQDEHEQLPTDVAAVFTPELTSGWTSYGFDSSLPSSRVIDDSWTADDAVGIVMLESGANLATTDVFNKYTAGSTGASSVLQPAAADQMLYFPAGGDNVNFIAYYPYGTVENSQVTYTMADQATTAKMEAVDVMYAALTGDYNKTNPAVALSFSHLLSKLTINVSTSSDAKAVDLSTLTAVTIAAVPESVSVNLGDGAITPATTAGTTTAFIKSKVAATAEVHAIVVPHIGTADGFFNYRKITFTTEGGSSYVYWLPLDAEFKTGEQYTFNLKVTTDGVDAVK